VFKAQVFCTHRTCSHGIEPVPQMVFSVHAVQQETVHAQLPQGLQLVPFHHGLASSVHLVHLETVHVQLP
jgi:hypothetical protein